MGIFSAILSAFGLQEEKPKNKTRNRGPAKTAAEKREARNERWLRKLETTNPGLYNDIMAAKNGIPTNKVGELDAFMETVKKAEKLGMFKKPNEMASDGSFRDIAQALGMFLPSLLQGVQSGQAHTPNTQPQLQYVPVVEPEPVHIPEPEVEMSFISSFVVGQLQRRTPAQAAQWLIEQPYPQARDLITKLTQTPDDRLLVLLDTIAQTAADYRGLVDWLRRNPEFLVATVQQIRILATQSAAEA